jgi:predicted RND superfamily exporter protein
LTAPATPDEIEVTGAPVAESLFGNYVLEDLGVPNALLGTPSGPRTEPLRWKIPASFYELRRLIARRIGLVPVAVLVMMLVLWVSFRNALAMLLPLPGVLAAMLFVFGLMGWLGVPVYLTTVVMPVLLMATGVTNDIYLFNRYFTLLRQQGAASHRELLFETFDKMASPVASTSLTTAAGFLSFAFSPLGPVRAFGVCTGAGVLFGLLCSLLLVPALLTLIEPAWLVSRRQTKGDVQSASTIMEGDRPPACTLANWFALLGPAVVRWRWCVAALVLLVTALTPLGVHRLVVQDSWTSGFDPQSDFSHATHLVNDQFDGMHLLFVSCKAPLLFKGQIPGSALTPTWLALPGDLVPDLAFLEGRSLRVFPAGTNAPITNAPAPTVWHTRIAKASRSANEIAAFTTRSATDSAVCQALSRASRLQFEIVGQSHLDPQIIQAIDELGAFIRAFPQYGVGGVLDPADYLRTTRYMLNPADPRARTLPASATEARVLWDYYRLARGPRRLSQAVDANFSESLTMVFLKNANFVDTAKLMRDIRAYERDHLSPKGITLGFAGDVALGQALIEGVVTTQLQSLFWSLAGIFVLTAWFGGSLRWGVYCLLPSVLAVLIKFAVMGWLGIPLGVATSMFAAMTLGIGVNCAIQLLEGYGQARAGGAPSLEAANRAMVLTGPPALVNTIAVSLGFGVLMLSQVPANARLGLLLVVGLVNCFVISLVLLPVLLHWWPLKGLRSGE